MGATTCIGISSTVCLLQSPRLVVLTVMIVVMMVVVMVASRVVGGEHF